MNIRLYATTLFAWSILAAGQPSPQSPDDGTPVASRITDVVVYADRAQVTRSATANLPPEAVRLAFAKLRLDRQAPCG